MKNKTYWKNLNASTRPYSLNNSRSTSSVALALDKHSNYIFVSFVISSVYDCNCYYHVGLVLQSYTEIITKLMQMYTLVYHMPQWYTCIISVIFKHAMRWTTVPFSPVRPHLKKEPYFLGLTTINLLPTTVAKYQEWYPASINTEGLLVAVNSRKQNWLSENKRLYNICINHSLFTRIHSRPTSLSV